MTPAPVPSPPPVPPGGAPSSDAWGALLDALLRGVAHTLSNRVAALDALVESGLVARDEPAGADLRAEVAKLHEFGRLVKLLPADGTGRVEALAMADVVADACALLALHPEGRKLDWSVTVDPSVLPVRVERWLLLRTLVLLLDVARADARGARSGAGPSRATATVAGDARHTTVVVAADGLAARDTTPGFRAARALARRLSAGLRAGAEGYVLSIPTLVEIRRRDGRA